MPSNQTQNYHLSQWEAGDKVLREDFNADNAAIDAALAALVAKETTLNTSLSKKGNCKIWSSTYKGAGGYGSSNPTKLTFPSLPLFALIISPNGDMMPVLPISCSTPCLTVGTGGRNYLTWSGSTASWYANTYPSEFIQMNASGVTYYVFAFYKMD